MIFDDFLEQALALAQRQGRCPIARLEHSLQ